MNELGQAFQHLLIKVHTSTLAVILWNGGASSNERLKCARKMIMPRLAKDWTNGVWGVGGCILLYYCASISLTLFNKWFFDDQNYGFHFPLSVTCFHQACIFCMLVTLEPLLTPLAGEITKDKKLMKPIFPIGAICGLDWGMSNFSFKYITVSLYEMVKSTVPLFVMLFSFALGVMKPTKTVISIVLMISCGMFLSVSGSRNFFKQGVCAIKIVMAQRVMQKIKVEGKNEQEEGKLLHNPPLNAITTLYYVAPSSAAVLFFPAICIEGYDMLEYFGYCGFS
eukprot:gene22877-1379_t